MSLQIGDRCIIAGSIYPENNGKVVVLVEPYDPGDKLFITSDKDEQNYYVTWRTGWQIDSLYYGGRDDERGDRWYGPYVKSGLLRKVE